MNKKKKIIGITSLGIVFIILIITIFKNTYAINPNTITLDCDKDSINSGDEFSCKIVGHFSNNVSGFSTSVSVSDDIEIVNIVSEWDAAIKSIESDNTIVLADDENTITGDVNIANINLKNKGNSKDDSTIKLQKVSIAYEEGGISKDMDISDVVKNIHIKSSNSYLSFLSISGASIDFKSNITEYSIDSLDQSVITISATSSIASSTITGDLGEQKLEYGKNIFKVTVTSEDGNSTTYTINIYRPSGNSSLDSLSVEGTNVEFNSEKLNYDLIINSDKTNITATASSSTSKVEGTGEKKLAYGKNEFKIIVTAENGSERTYILNITRYDTNNTLKSIKINGEEVKINDNKVITFTTKLDKIKIEVNANSDRVKSITGTGEKNIVYGANEFEIIVTAENGDIRTYKLVVNRLSDNRLSKLTINGKDIDLKDNIYSYDFEVDSDIDKVKIDAKLQDEKNKFVDGYGPRTINNLESNKTKVVLKTKGQDGNDVTYIINIIKKDKDKSEEDINKNIKTGVASICLVAIIALVTLLIGIIAYRKRNDLI
ncbi:MAG: cadherin-like beta sandwich domain-containing protein [Bacilli bacterium]|nr:cadherin-like beta sandwich domain-containing protein [Bacilli bacterium]